MEEIIMFQQSVLEDTFLSFFHIYRKKDKKVQLKFIRKLKESNLDIFFYQLVKENNLIENLEEEIILPLKQEFLIEKGRDKFYKEQFIEILRNKKFPMLLMKGWQLRDSIGLDLYKRSCDVDILIYEKDFAAAVSLLENEFNFFLKPNYIAYGQSCFLNDNSMCIDLHQKLIVEQSFDSIFNLHAENLFKEAYLKKDLGAEYSVFNLEMELVHLCIHFLYHHRGHGFILLYELKRYLVKNHSSIDTDKLLEVAGKHRNLPTLLYCFMAIKELCILPTNTLLWVDDVVKKNDFDNRVVKIFIRSFKKNNFHRNIGVAKFKLRQLILNDFSKVFLYLKGSIEFSIHCNILLIKKRFS